MSTEIVPSKPLPPAPVPIIGGVAAPQDVEGAFRIATLFHRTGMLPQGVSTPEQALVALMAGMECGLSPTQSLQNVMVVNKRPTIWGDAAIGLVWNSGKMESHDEGIEGAGDNRAAFCTVKRAGDAKPYTIRFSVDDAKKANLWGKAGPWTQYPDRMLKLRARAFALRDKFADVLKGLGIREEIEDHDQPHGRTVAVVSTQSRPSLSERLDATTEETQPPQGAESHAPPSAPARPGETRPAFDLEGNPISTDDIDAVMAKASPVVRSKQEASK